MASPPQNKNFANTSKNLPKTRNQTLPTRRYPKRKLQPASDKLSMAADATPPQAIPVCNFEENVMIKTQKNSEKPLL